MYISFLYCYTYVPCHTHELPGFRLFRYKGVKKTLPVVTFLIAEGVKIIVQQCYTPRWKALDVSFQVITESFLCERYFLRYR